MVLMYCLLAVFIGVLLVIQYTEIISLHSSIVTSNYSCIMLVNVLIPCRIIILCKTATYHSQNYAGILYRLKPKHTGCKKVRPSWKHQFMYFVLVHVCKQKLVEAKAFLNIYHFMQLFQIMQTLIIIIATYLVANANRTNVRLWSKFI